MVTGAFGGRAQARAPETPGLAPQASPCSLPPSPSLPWGSQSQSEEERGARGHRGPDLT